MDPQKKRELEQLAVKVRIGIVDQLKFFGVGHIGGCLSIADTIAVLYGDIMRYDPSDPKKADRDKLVISKGHTGPAQYAALAIKGFFPYDTLYTLNRGGTILPSHCDRNKTPGVDMTTGSLGQGSSLAVGMALGDKLKGRDSRTFLICGDGEINEGQFWEAMMFTAAKKVNNLVVMIDNNKKQLDGTTEEVLDIGDIRAKMEAFGFETRQIDGNDIEALHSSLSETGKTGKPTAIILDTIKGKGIPEVESTYANHSMTVTAENGERWLAHLNEEYARIG